MRNSKIKKFILHGAIKKFISQMKNPDEKKWFLRPLSIVVNRRYYILPELITIISNLNLQRNFLLPQAMPLQDRE